MADITLTASETTRIEWVIDYLIIGGAGKPIDDKTVDELDKIFGGRGPFKCGCPGTFQEGMRDQPIPTLLKALLLTAAT